MPHRVTVREALPGDARAIAQIHVDSWRAGYAGLLDQAMLDDLSVDEREEQWAERIGGAGVRILVADDLSGFIAVGLPGHLGVPAGVARVLALYVDPASWRRGVGSALLAEGLRDLPDVREIDLWVVEGNERATRFYERHGFRADGSAEYDEKSGRTEFRMVRNG